ncbi:basic blue protein [Cajanus cajan]|uniref:Basic blue protein n=1 Tax=Cajanus cajan TaxID=3821 RepID=A0A151T7V3_CAJCA|nr:basic blue protein [Cajanus cajan]KYP63140.1 Basic blue protein [Cajanus cajan]
MAKERGIGAVSVIVFCMLMLYSEMAHASTYVVGGRTGWTFNMTAWVKGTYKAGDKLLFYYNATQHNVVMVDEAGYNSCTASKGSKTYQSGRDYIELAKGSTYFICTFPGHCQDHGMKVAALAV